MRCYATILLILLLYGCAHLQSKDRTTTNQLISCSAAMDQIRTACASKVADDSCNGAVLAATPYCYGSDVRSACESATVESSVLCPVDGRSTLRCIRSQTAVRMFCEPTKTSLQRR
jgi:hypothetical protein